MLIVRTPSVTDFLLGNGHNLGDFQDLLQRLQGCFKMRNNDPHIRELIVQTCQKHLTAAYPDSGKRDLFLGAIAISASFIADRNLFRNAIKLAKHGFDEHTFLVLGELICFQPPTGPEHE